MASLQDGLSTSETHQTASPIIDGLRCTQPILRTPLAALIRWRWNPRLVEAALDHRIDLTHQDMRSDLILGAAELSQRCQQSEVIERLGRQRQAQRPRLRAVFRSRHLGSYAF